MRGLAVALALQLLAGCQLRARAPATRPPLAGEGDLRVYLQPFPDDAARLAISLSAISAVARDGALVPLDVVQAELGGEASRAQRLLAHGRVAPGEYAGIALHVRQATLAGEQGPARLLVPEEPVRVAMPFRVERGRALVLALFLGREQALAREFQFDAAFTGAVLAPESRPPALAGYCATPALGSLTVFDRRSREVTGIIPTGRQPLGLALDARNLRAYVALGAEDQIQVLDLATGTEVRRITLRTGDEPRELALTPEGDLLVVVNQGSNSVAFVDTATASVVGTAPTGLEPGALLLDPAGRRAYVLNRRSGSLTMLDVATRAVAATVTTDPEPLRAALSRDGTRLYLVARGSAFMTVLGVPELTVVRTVFVGLGAAAVKVDPRTGVVYVGRSDEGRIQIFDPASALPVDSIAVPGPVTHLSLDPLENVLVAVLPTLGQLAFVDLTRRRTIAVLDAGGEPFQVATTGGF